uniref:Uncharacterized protein n=1 Tax=Steinernema glaseri TaxID=37863 RepID=A0A1I7Y762_9BILA
MDKASEEDVLCHVRREVPSRCGLGLLHLGHRGLPHRHPLALHHHQRDARRGRGRCPGLPRGDGQRLDPHDGHPTVRVAPDQAPRQPL